MLRYTVILERGDTSWSVYVPDLPGCVAVGATREEALELIRGAINMHLEGMLEDGLPIPEPCSEVEVVEVGAA